MSRWSNFSVRTKLTLMTMAACGAALALVSSGVVLNEIASGRAQLTAKLESVAGHAGKALALDFAFTAGSGYAIAQKRLPLALPENYKFTFYLRGETPVNNFEFKLLDSLDNVYWIKQLNIDYPREWKKRTIKKRHISFAWGPSGPGVLRKVDRMEFVISAGTGGKGKS